MYYYVISDTNCVEIFKRGDKTPILRQPCYPNGDKFDTYKEARAWAILFIKSLVDEDAFYAPNGKGLSGEPKLTEEERLAALKRSKEVELVSLKQLADSFAEEVPDPLAQRIANLESEISAS